MPDDSETIAHLRSELQRAKQQLESVRQDAPGSHESVAELRRSEELNRRLIEAMPGGVVHVTAAGAIQTANAEAQRILGLSYDELAHRYVADFEPHTVFEDGRACSAQEYPVTQALTTGMPQPPVTIGVERPDGGISWALFTAVPIKEEDGTTSGAVVTFLDITRRKRLEHELREAQKMEAIGRLAGGIAHDFNNLLTVIIGNTAYLRQGLGPSHPSLEDLDHVLGAANKASSLTSQLLAFASRQLVAPSLLDLDELVDETASMLRRLIGEHIELVVEHERPVWQVRVDRSQFEQVIINLSLNARDAMPEGGCLTLRVTNARGADGSERVELSAADTGPGINDETLEHIFEPFFTTKQAGAGTGLGLATCYGIAKQAGGTIDVDSGPTGTTFTVGIPRAFGEGPQRATSEAGHPDAGTETVLLVEDDAAVRRVLERGLVLLGYRVLTAHEGTQALQLLESDDGVDVVVTDVMMPGPSGAEVADRVHRLRPGLPVILMSGYPERIHEGGSETKFPYLRKPFDPKELAALVRRLLSA